MFDFVRRRAKSLPPADVWQRLRSEAFERSGGRCQCYGDCGKHVGQCPVRIHPGPGGFHADHILPKNPPDPTVPRGPDVPANIRALCSDCNLAKSNRMVALPDGALRDASRTMVAIQARLAFVPNAHTRPFLAILQINTILPPERRIQWWIPAPHVVTLRLWPAEGCEVLTAKAEAAIMAAVRSPTARVYRHGDEWRVEIPRWPRPPVDLADMPAWGIGVDPSNQHVCVNPWDSPGVLIAGQSGSGKSTLLQALIYHTARAGGRLIIIDPKYRAGGAALRPFRRLAALECAVANSAADVDAALALAAFIMDEREPGGRHPLLAVVVDEIIELTAEQRAAVERIAKLGREVNVQPFVATQHPTKDVVTNALKNNLTWWAAGRVQNASASTLVIGRSGAQHLGGRGDMIIAHGGRDVRVQVPLGGPADWARLAMLDTEPAPAPRVERSDPRYERKPIDDRLAYARDLAADGVRPTGYRLNKALGGNNDRNHEIAAEVRAAFGMG